MSRKLSRNGGGSRSSVRRAMASMSASVGIWPERRSAGVIARAVGDQALTEQPCPSRRLTLDERPFQEVRSGGRVVEGARLESEYTAKPYRGFESLPLRHIANVLLSLNFRVQMFRRELAPFDLIGDPREALQRREMPPESSIFSEG